MQHESRAGAGPVGQRQCESWVGAAPLGQGQRRILWQHSPSTRLQSRARQLDSNPSNQSRAGHAQATSSQQLAYASSSSSDEVQLSYSDSVHMDDDDLHSCAISRLQLGSSHSEQSLGEPAAASASNTDVSAAEAAAGIEHSFQQAVKISHDCRVEPGDQVRQHAPPPLTVATSSSSDSAVSQGSKRSSHSEMTLLDEMVASPRHQPSHKRSKLSQARRLKF